MQNKESQSVVVRNGGGRKDYKGHRETLGNDEEVYFDVIASRMHNMSKLIKMHLLNMDSVLFFNYTPNKVQTFFLKKILKHLLI